MKRMAIWGGAMLWFLNLWGCGAAPPGGGAARGAPVLIRVSWPPVPGRAIPAETETLEVKVTAADLAQPITTTIPRGQESAILYVPPGKDRTFTVLAKDAEGYEIGRGEEKGLAIVAGQVNRVTVTITPLPGSAQVSIDWTTEPSPVDIKVDWRPGTGNGKVELSIEWAE